MPAIALSCCLVFSTWLVARDCFRRRSVSPAVWIPTLLLLILGSRPVSLWMGRGNVGFTGLSNDAETSSLDLAFFLFVLSASFVIASARGLNWKSLFAANGAIMLFYLYFALSVSWSGDPSGSLKRIIKDFGLLFVVGVILSEKDPLQAMRAIYVRCAFVLIPLSVVLVKYFPEYARSYSIEGDIMVTGVTTQKNSLGEIVLILMLFLTWDYLATIRPIRSFRATQIPWDRVIIVLMAVWLLHLSQSKTALLCTIVGGFLVVRTGHFVSKALNMSVLLGALSLPVLVFCSQQFSSLVAPLIEALGRNMTFTGRTNIWAHITLGTVNPLIGAGYWNFWGGVGGMAIDEAMQTSVPNAHNGYLDIYLDGGIIGLIMLSILLIVSGRRIVKKLKLASQSDRYQKMRFAILIVAIIYNLSESTFARMGPMWFTTLLMIVEYPSLRRSLQKDQKQEAVHRIHHADQAFAQHHRLLR